MTNQERIVMVFRCIARSRCGLTVPFLQAYLLGNGWFLFTCTRHPSIPEQCCSQLNYHYLFVAFYLRTYIIISVLVFSEASPEFWSSLLSERAAAEIEYAKRLTRCKTSAAAQYKKLTGIRLSRTLNGFGLFLKTRVFYTDTF